jgi:hypothetical protein
MLGERLIKEESVLVLRIMCEEMDVEDDRGTERVW